MKGRGKGDGFRYWRWELMALTSTASLLWCMYAMALLSPHQNSISTARYSCMHGALRRKSISIKLAYVKTK